jgi:hypothetical protein
MIRPLELFFSIQRSGMFFCFLGNCSAPTVGWQIDPFGHSSENARLFNWMGFHGLFFARNDFRDREQRTANKTLNMIWNVGETSQGSSNIPQFIQNSLAAGIDCVLLENISRNSKNKISPIILVKVKLLAGND